MFLLTNIISLPESSSSSVVIVVVDVIVAAAEVEAVKAFSVEVEVGSCTESYAWGKIWNEEIFFKK